MSGAVRFRVRAGTDAKRMLGALEQRAGLVREPSRVLERTIFETFDWRLFAADSMLEHRLGGPTPMLVWRSLSTGEVLGHLQVDAMPRFAWHLPHTPVADRLARLTEIRALVPLVTLESRIEGLCLVDGDGKTEARLTLDRTSVRDGPRLPVFVELVPVRGYERAARELAELLDAQVSLTRESDDLAVLALRAAGFAPGSYSSKLRLDLDEEATARDAWVTVLRALFATMQVNEAGLRDDVDSEFLHDFRVAVRRTRSVLAQARGVLEPQVLEWARDEFRWIGQITSPARDADVFLLTLPDFEAALPAERRGDLKPFDAFLQEQQRQAHATLVEALDGKRYRALVARWREFLESAPSTDPPPEAMARAIEVAGGRIRKAHRRVIRHGRAITAASHPEDLHELRKDAKRLRYLLECFGSLYPRELIEPVVRELKGLQDVLGSFQDTQVQAQAIEHDGQEMIEQRGAPAATLIAMGSIVEHLDTAGRAARAHFTKRFGRFDDRDVRRAIARVGGHGESVPLEERG